MSDQKTYTLQEASGLIRDELRKQMREWEDVLVSLRKRELKKADGHYEPGTHETPGTGVAPHMEPGTHENHSFGPGGPQEHGSEPVGSDAGIPMNGQPANSTPGGEICPMCNQPDLPGSCVCLGGTAPIYSGGDVDGFDRSDADLGVDAELGGGTLRMSEKPLAKAQKRKVTAFQVNKMTTKKGEMAPDGGSSPVSMDMDGGGDMNAGQGDISGASLAQSEMGEGSKMKKDLASATADLKSKNQMLDAANKVRATKPMFTPGSKFSKEEWIDIANEGDPVKRLKNFPDGSSETAVPASSGNKGAEKRGQGIEPKRVKSADDESTPEMEMGVKKGEKKDEGKAKYQTCPECEANFKLAPAEKFPAHKFLGKPCPGTGTDIKKSSVPEAKPPSGQNMGTAVPKAKVAAPKLPGAGLKPPASKAPAAPKLPGMGKMPAMGAAPAGVVKGEKAPDKATQTLFEDPEPKVLHPSDKKAKSVPAKHQAKIAAQDAKMPKPMKDVMSPPVKKAMMPAHKQMAMQASADAHAAHRAQGTTPAPAVKLPGAAEQDARAQMYSDFMPKTAPAVPGLKAPPKLPGMGRPATKPAPKPMFGKGEMEDLKCSMCKSSEHAGECK